MPGQLRLGRRVLHVMTMASIIVVPAAYSTTARVAASPAPAAPVPLVEDADTFTADISIRQAFVGPDGSAVQPPPPAVDMRMERWLATTGWRTAITLRDIERPLSIRRPGTRVENPFLVVRMEYDGDGSEPRYFNQRGERVRAVGDVDTRLFNIPASVRAQMRAADLSTLRVSSALAGSPRPDWLDNVVATPARRALRRQALEDRYGAVRGRVNGLDQYVTTTGDATAEVLVNPKDVVPVEINLARGQTLVARNAFTHEARPDRVLVRRHLHAEQLWATARGTRAITDVSVSNVVVSQRGIQ